MATRSNILAVLTMSLLLAACGSIPVQQDYDQQARFTNLKTFAWQDNTQKPTGDARIDNSLLDDRVRNAVDTNLAGKGFRKAATGKPDFLVAYHYAIREQQNDNRPRSSVGFGVGSGGYFGGFRLGIGSQNDDYDRYELIIDVIDPAAKKLMWRGSVKRRLIYSSEPAKTTERVNSTVAAILGKFPPGAKR